MRYIIEDTLQKKGMHEIKHASFKASGVEIIPCRLPFGDYVLPPRRSVDTKADMAEIASNIGSDHKRFRAECVKALNAGCELTILVENTEGITCVDDVRNWINPQLIYRPKAITGERLAKSMTTMTKKYGVRFEFCRPEEAADKIMEILTR